MKLPRDLAVADLEKSLRRKFGYQFTPQSGSHRRLTVDDLLRQLELGRSPRPPVILSESG